MEKVLFNHSCQDINKQTALFAKDIFSQINCCELQRKITAKNNTRLNSCQGNYHDSVARLLEDVSGEMRGSKDAAESQRIQSCIQKAFKLQPIHHLSRKRLAIFLVFYGFLVWTPRTDLLGISTW